MPGVGVLDNRGDIVGEKKFRVVLAIEEKVEVMFRMLGRNPLQRFIGKPTDTFQTVTDQQPCVDGDVH